MLTIGQLAGRFGLATHVLRHWEDVGVLTPAERVNGRRRYRPAQAARVALILRAKEAGMSLEQIRELFEAPGHPDRRAILARHHAELERRLREIRQAKEMVEHILNCPEEDFTECPIFLGLVARSMEGARADAGGCDEPAHHRADAVEVTSEA